MSRKVEKIMDEERKKAPIILTSKDLDYLKDIFGWNHIAYKVCEDALTNVEDKKVCKVISDCSKLFYKNMTIVLDILKDGDFHE